RQRCAAVLSWFAATRPVAICPAPDTPPVSVNQGRCAGAFICVRTQTKDLPASALSCSIISRALMESAGRPPCCDVFISFSYRRTRRADRCSNPYPWSALGLRLSRLTSPYASSATVLRRTYLRTLDLQHIVQLWPHSLSNLRNQFWRRRI